MSFEAGRLKNYIENWRKITSDPVILDIVEHCHIEFSPGCEPVNSYFTFNENEIIDREIQKLLDMKVKEVEHTLENIHLQFSLYLRKMVNIE